MDPEQGMESLLKFGFLDFSGSPVVKIPHFHCRGPQVRSLVGKLRFHMLCKAVKNK